MILIKLTAFLAFCYAAAAAGPVFCLAATGNEMQWKAPAACDGKIEIFKLAFTSATMNSIHFLCCLRFIIQRKQRAGKSSSVS